jgi:hypothetical protein
MVVVLLASNSDCEDVISYELNVRLSRVFLYPPTLLYSLSDHLIVGVVDLTSTMNM